MKRYMVLVANGGRVYVKDHDFFISQGGDKKPWGKSWREVQATSIRNAVKKACDIFPDALPYERQAMSHDSNPQYDSN